MKIRKVRLQNIKSYVDQEVSFHDGVNFISGINGAGKSTLIEAIGYGLFDYNPYPNIKDLIRYGAKSGIITIEFLANDDREYRTLRKIGTSTLWAVFDLETNSELDLHGSKDVQEWLKGALGIDRDIELSQLFEDVVGVPQGTFIAPFIEKPSIRKKKFDGILKVEQYRHAFNNSGEARSTLNKGIDSMNTELLIKAEQIRDYDQVRTEIVQLEKQIELLTTTLKELEINIKVKDAEIKQIEDVRVNLEKVESNIKALQEKEKGLHQKQQLLDTNLMKAKEAKAILQSSEAGFKGYIELEEMLKSLEAKRLEKEKLEKEQNSLKQGIATLEAQVKQSQLTLTKQQQEIAENKETYSKQVQDLTEHLKKFDQELVKNEAQKAIINTWLQAEEKLKGVIDQLEDAKRNINSKEEQINLLQKEEKQLGEQLRTLPEIEALASTLETKEEALSKAREDYEVLKARLQTLKKNLEQSRGGLCPFLDSPCQNIQGNLEEFFNSQIKETEKEMKLLTEKGIMTKKEREEAKTARDKYIKLQGERERLNQVKTQKEKFAAEIYQLLTKATTLSLPDRLEKLQQSSKLTFTRFNEALQQYANLNKEELNINIFNLDSVLSCLEDILSTSKTNREEQSSSLTEEFNLYSNRKAKTKADYNNAANNLKQLLTKEEQLNLEKKAISENIVKVDQIKNQLKLTTEKMANFQGLNEELTQTKTRQNQYRKDYDIYRQNQVEAGKVATLENEARKVIEERTDANNSLKELSEIQTQLLAQFNPEEYQRKRNLLETIKQEEAAKKQIFRERQEDLTQDRNRLAQMEKVIKQIEKIKTEMAKSQRTLALLDIVRSVLNKSGPPIAKVYLQNLSKEANDLYRQVSKENVALEWLEGYDIALVDNFNGKKRERSFKQFSGGEQMTAALAIRLALLKQQSRVKVGFFDEPTANLDSERRLNLAETIPRVTGGFDQIFIISHDDTFDEITENIIQLKKDEGEGSSLISS